MKKIIYIFTLLVIAVSFQSCREDYLNELQPTDAIAPDVIYSTYEGAQAHIAGILRRTRGQFTENHDTGNLGSMYFARENKGNISINNNGWFRFDYANDNRAANVRRTSFTWSFLYSLINQVNACVEGVEKSAGIGSVDKNKLLGQLYTMRAMFYFELSLEFQHTYKYDTALFAPPIYKKSGELEGKPLSTQKEMYEFIVSDLEKAIEIGSEDRIDNSYFNKSVSYAVAARVYQVMENWDKAGAYAKLAYGGVPESVLSPEAYQLGFDNMNEGKEWLLANPQTADQSNYYALAPHAFYTQTESAYNNTFITKSFPLLFTSTDVRYQFATTAATDYRQWYTKKFKFAFDAHLPLIRTPEMILIETEALYHTNPDQAHDLLYKLQKNRDVNAVKSSNTGNELLNEILLERKKELYGEIGVEWYDAKRLRRGIVRDSWHRINLLNNPLVPDDKRFYLLIPQSELDANPSIPKDINTNR
ncbi:RagB/SusD family nutrient uptake outer membrane protein [Chryseobacterium sp. G0186]|uniref:RagB/SusD family nutrient uptake outer membrane protein n=1 Tax=Chryseobacterium sp. G0186 TaxID=2487064 RepID=UPI000F502B33|nr:RagB/SusD family nutrient uptake outer membrane protein [Chryseobacterium sp. G0186]AZA77505.1 RagB/SusD family nutrient uptake outer membrane protein [Chryseobacterium sp. G0186]